MSVPPQERIAQLCAEFRLPTVAAEVVPRFQASDHGAALATLLEVFELEASDRRQRRVDRLRRAAKLPAGKTWETLDRTRLPIKLQQQLDELATGAFLDRAVNVLAFGLPGTGKTHAMAALGHRLIEQGHSVAFVPTYQLVQDLLAAKRDLDLPRMLRKLDHFEVIILDDLGYLKHRADEAEVLFTLIAERYERRSLIITSNMVFSQWEEIFQSPMATAAAIDRIVHHSVIAEFDVQSYRTAAAQDQATGKHKSSASRRRTKK
jgi:DNA replication protein DnaC